MFTGVGGLDYGFEAAGFETSVALDFDPIACRTLRLNRPWPLIEGDISQVTSRTILDTAGLKLGEADVLIGGPPCQPFSKSGYWANGDSRRLDDPRADTLSQYLRVLRDTLPRAFLLENVPGLAYRGKNEGIEAIRRGIERINLETGARYVFKSASLNAVEFGVPQIRERVFVVGSREHDEFMFPEPTHSSPRGRPSNRSLKKYLTAWDAIGDLPSEPNNQDLRMTGKWADLLPTIPEGQNYLWHTRRGGGSPLFGWRRRYWSFLLKLSKSLPSWTIQAQPGPATGPFHWRNRKLSAAELGRIQTFPDGLAYDCSHAEVQKLVGNAVPSALAELLARELASQFLGAGLAADPLTLAPTRREESPEPEALHPVPDKYQHLIGDHDEHPGTGKGRRAAAQQSLMVQR